MKISVCKRGKDEAVQRGGERESRKRIRSEQDAQLRDTTMKKTELWSRQLRRDDRVGLSEKSRAVPRGSRERKGLSRGIETYIFHGANETAQCGGMDAPSFSGPRCSGLRPDHGAVALGRRRWDERGSGRWLAGVERSENSVAHEHPSTDEHGLLYVEQRECRACDVSLRSLLRGNNCGSQQGRQC
ncbi:hypothetical protein ALC62_01591 [Cyphomyrmex costatus]|uniref:Uncharacterized protein n=1 Tax=Cyphomyrmex costatus TaxID=456900 RepID=A0A195D4N3_9HYME|nr:hypothetical protein ALC62_01591 [Cyphomyrmex costatus]